MSESAVQSVTIKATQSGPYEVVGEVQILDAEGNVIRETSKAFLCRCGHSQNKPFCDGHHRRLNWQDTEPDAAPQ
jgi:CDGSH-type Zn-finger protein